MTLYQAKIEDDDAIQAFYDDVTARTPDISLHARWSKGKHPTAVGIRTYIKEGSMFLYKEHDIIVGAMAVTMYQGEDYHAIEWSEQVPDDKVAVIHILAVHPDHQGSGVGSEMVREAIRLAKKNDIKAIRLDALASNTPAHKIYEHLGFEYRGKQYLYAENTGWTDFYFFELKQSTYKQENRMKQSFREEAIACVKDHVLPIHQQIYAKFDGDFDRIYAEGYNSRSYQGRVIEPGKVYELSYLECSCPKVKCGLRKHPQQCECSRQSIMYILSQLEPDSRFEVRIENTILRGGERCTFRITRNKGMKK